MARNKITIGGVTEQLNDARLPASLGTAGQILKMNSSANAIEWGTDETGSTVSGANDGTNWTSITINGTTMLIPAGGSGGVSLYQHNILLQGYIHSMVSIVTTDATPFVDSTLRTWLYNQGYKSEYNFYPVVSMYFSSSSVSIPMSTVLGVYHHNGTSYGLDVVYWNSASVTPSKYTEAAYLISSDRVRQIC